MNISQRARIEIFAAVLAFSAAVFLCSQNTRGQAPSQQKIKVLTLLGRPLQIVVAEKQGLLAKYGVEVETANKANSEELRSELAAGNGALAYLAVDNAVAMVELAHQDVIIVMGGEGSQNELIVQPGNQIDQGFAGKNFDRGRSEHGLRAATDQNSVPERLESQ